MAPMRLSRALRALREAVSSREFWLLLLWLCAVLAALTWLAWLAVRHFDSFLRIKPLLCESGIGDRQLLAVALAGPLGIALTLAGFGELWLLRDARRAGHRVRWRHFILFASTAALCAVVVFQALGC